MKTKKHPGERVAFYLSPATYSAIKAIAGKSPEQVNNWCRLVVESELTKGESHDTI